MLWFAQASRVCLIRAKLGAKKRTVLALIFSVIHKDVKVFPVPHAAITLPLFEFLKPFIVSFGSVAASGGYYISASADRIFANSNTITGSIGVFGMIPAFTL